jgi:hypothetical protein
LFDAVTVKSNVDPTSAELAVYEAPVAPATGMQEATALVQRFH